MILTFFLKILGHIGLINRKHLTGRLQLRWAKQSSHIITEIPPSSWISVASKPFFTIVVVQVYKFKYNAPEGLQ